MLTCSTAQKRATGSRIAAPKSPKNRRRRRAEGEVERQAEEQLDVHGDHEDAAPAIGARRGVAGLRRKGRDGCAETDRDGQPPKPGMKKESERIHGGTLSARQGKPRSRARRPAGDAASSIEPLAGASDLLARGVAARARPARARAAHPARRRSACSAARSAASSVPCAAARSFARLCGLLIGPAARPRRALRPFRTAFSAGPAAACAQCAASPARASKPAGCERLDEPARRSCAVAVPARATRASGRARSDAGCAPAASAQRRRLPDRLGQGRAVRVGGPPHIGPPALERAESGPRGVLGPLFTSRSVDGARLPENLVDRPRHQRRLAPSLRTSSASSPVSDFASALRAAVNSLEGAGRVRRSQPSNLDISSSDVWSLIGRLKSINVQMTRFR